TPRSKKTKITQQKQKQQQPLKQTYPARSFKHLSPAGSPKSAEYGRHQTDEAGRVVAVGSSIDTSEGLSIVDMRDILMESPGMLKSLTHIFKVNGYDDDDDDDDDDPYVLMGGVHMFDGGGNHVYHAYARTSVFDAIVSSDTSDAVRVRLLNHVSDERCRHLYLRDHPDIVKALRKQMPDVEMHADGVEKQGRLSVLTAWSLPHSAAGVKAAVYAAGRCDMAWLLQNPSWRGPGFGGDEGPPSVSQSRHGAASSEAAAAAAALSSSSSSSSSPYSLTFDTTASVLASTKGILVIEFHNRMTGSGVCGKSPPVSFNEVNDFIRSLGLNPRSVIMQTEAEYISPGTEKQPGMNRHLMIGAWTANMLTLLQGTCACGQSDCKVRFREKQAWHMGGVHFDHPDPETKTKGQKTNSLFRYNFDRYPKKLEEISTLRALEADPGTKREGENTAILFHYNFNRYPKKLKEIRTLRALEAGHHWQGQKGGGKLGKQRAHVPFTHEHEAD
ncbi:hypothetical protein TrRE_jg9462, partial [Triparma retinervis]